MLGKSSYSITEWLSQLDEPQLANEAWTRLLERLYPVSVARARERGLSAEDAQSVHQRAVIKMFVRLKTGAVTVTNRGQLFGLLSKIASDEIVDRFRSHDRLRLLPNLLADGDDSAVDDTLPRWLRSTDLTLEQEEETNLLERRLLAAMSDEQLAVYQLRVEEELEVEQIKERLNKSRESIYRRLQEIDDIIRAISTDSELVWLRDTARDTSARSTREKVAQFLDGPIHEAHQLWMAGEAPEAIAAALRTTPTKTYELLAELDDVVYVVRHEATLEQLRQQLQKADDETLRNDIRAIVKTRKWPIFERWIRGGGPAALIAEGEFKRSAVFAALRAFHESARAIRRVL